MFKFTFTQPTVHRHPAQSSIALFPSTASIASVTSSSSIPPPKPNGTFSARFTRSIGKTLFPSRQNVRSRMPMLLNNYTPSSKTNPFPPSEPNFVRKASRCYTMATPTMLSTSSATCSSTSMPKVLTWNG